MGRKQIALAVFAAFVAGVGVGSLLSRLPGSAPPQAAPPGNPATAAAASETAAAAGTPAPSGTDPVGPGGSSAAGPSGREVLYVGNTDGEGVYVRWTPSPADTVKAYPDGTRLDVIGPEVERNGVVWVRVRAPDGLVGWVPRQYTTTVVPTLEPA